MTDAIAFARDRTADEVRRAWLRAEASGEDLQLALTRAIVKGLYDAGLVTETTQEREARLDRQMLLQYDALGGGPGAARVVARRFVLNPFSSLEVETGAQHIRYLARYRGKT